jgi:spermidine synthase
MIAFMPPSRDNPPAPRRLADWPYPLPTLPEGRRWDEPVPVQIAGASPLHCIETSDEFDLYSYRVTAVLHSGHTRFQHIVIADSVNFGRILLLDGGIQSSDDDEALYHEMLVQPAMLMHPDPRDVLIIGGGEGATLREVVAHASVRRATMVDLDEEAVELCRTHMTSWHRGAFEDPRVELIFADGRDFVEKSDAFYDVVIIDVVDMLDNGPAQRLYTRQFYEALKRRLRPGGIVTVQGLEFSFLDHQGHAALFRTLKSVFANVGSYTCTIPSFLAPWGFLLASDDAELSVVTADQIDRAIDAKLGPDWLVHLTGEFLLGCRAYDRETRLLLALPGPLLEDDVPYVPLPDVDDTWPEKVRFPAKDRRG